MTGQSTDFKTAIRSAREVLRGAAENFFDAGFSREDLLHRALEARRHFDADRLSTDALFGDAESGHDYARIFDRWRVRPPSMAALLSTAAERLRVPADHPVFTAALMAGFAADIPSRNAYHDNAHFREVTAMMAVYADANQSLAAAGRLRAVELDAAELAKCLLAAAAHDLGHDGTGNRVDGAYVPYRLENRAIAAIEPFMALAGMSDKDCEDVRVMIRVTDVGAPQGLPSPHKVLRSLMRGEATVVPRELMPLAKDSRLMQLAALMSDADLAPSAGLNYINGSRQTRRLAQENPAISPTDESLRGFLEFVVERSFISPGGRHKSQGDLAALFNKTSDRITRRAQRQPRGPAP